MHSIIFIIRTPFVFTLSQVSQHKFPFPFNSRGAPLMSRKSTKLNGSGNLFTPGRNTTQETNFCSCSDISPPLVSYRDWCEKPQTEGLRATSRNYKEWGPGQPHPTPHPGVGWGASRAAVEGGCALAKWEEAECPALFPGENQCRVDLTTTQAYRLSGGRCPLFYSQI